MKVRCINHATFTWRRKDGDSCSHRAPHRQNYGCGAKCDHGGECKGESDATAKV